MTITALLKLEWMKMKNYTLFKVIAGFYLIFLPASLLITKTWNTNSADIGFDVKSFLMFPSVWNYLAYTGNWIAYFVFGFLGVTLITNEFSDRTLRQNIISGMTRSSFFKAKVVFIAAISIVATLYFILMALAIGFFNTETIYWDKIWQESAIIVRYLMMCLSYLSFGLMLGMLMKRTALATIFYFIYVFFIELVWRWGVHYQVVKNTGNSTVIKTMHFYPMNIVEDLTPTPLPAMVQGMSEEFKFPIFLTPTEALLGSIFYVLLFLYCCRLLLMKKDL